MMFFWKPSAAATLKLCETLKLNWYFTDAGHFYVAIQKYAFWSADDGRYGKVEPKMFYSGSERSWTDGREHKWIGITTWLWVQHLPLLRSGDHVSVTTLTWCSVHVMYRTYTLKPHVWNTFTLYPLLWLSRVFTTLALATCGLGWCDSCCMFALLPSPLSETTDSARRGNGRNALYWLACATAPSRENPLKYVDASLRCQLISRFYMDESVTQA